VDEAIKIVEMKIETNWKSLAQNLGFETTEIDAITNENPHDLKECIHHFFSQWKQKEASNVSNVSVLKLVNGLLGAELVTIADEVSRQCLGIIFKKLDVML